MRFRTSIGPRLFFRRAGLALFAAALLGTATLQANTITIDPTTRYQTIDGFGWHGTMGLYWENGPFFNEAWTSLVIDTLGLTISRNSYDDSASFETKERAALLALKKRAEASHEPLIFWASIWSPPPHMKTSNRAAGGSLKPSEYANYGKWLVAAAQQYKAAGIPLYGISPQNEPSVPDTDHGTCVYKPASTYIDMFNTIAPLVKATFPAIKLLGSENCCLDFQTAGFNADLLNNATSRKYLDIFAYHDYQGTAVWSDTAYHRLDTLMRGKPQRLWQTESGYQGDDMGTVMKAMNEIHNNLTIVPTNAYLWWQGCGDSDLKNFAVIDHSGTIGKRFWALRQYYRFVRPGAVRIKAEPATADTNLRVTAFKRKTSSGEENWAIVMVNRSMDVKGIRLAGKGLPSKFDQYQTSAASNGSKRSSIANSDSLTLPAQSITTLVSGDFHGGVDIGNGKLK